MRAASALRDRRDWPGALRHAIAVADMQFAAAILMDSMHTILDVTHSRETTAVARAWHARFGDAAAEANPEQLLQFVLLLAASGHREAEDWLTKVNRAHPVPRRLSSRLTTAEIASALFVSPNTLKSHIKSIYRKLDVSSRSDAVRDGEARGML